MQRVRDFSLSRALSNRYFEREVAAERVRDRDRERERERERARERKKEKFKPIPLIYSY